MDPLQDMIIKVSAFMAACVLVFCLASCTKKPEETTTSAPSYYVPSEQSTTAPSEETTKQTKQPGTKGELSTVVLTTAPGGVIPTVVTSQWNTTLPAGTPVTTEPTTMYLTVPPGYSVAPPVVMSTMAVTTTEPSTTSAVPSTDVITQTDPNGQVVTVYSTDSPSSTEGTTVSPKPSDSKTTEPTTEKPQPQAINLVESGFCAFDSDGYFVCGFEGTGWQESFKVMNTRIDITVNGETVKRVSVTADGTLNEDGGIDVVLKTNSAQVQTGDTVTFTLPQGFIKSNDGMLYSNAKTVTVFAS